jgi:hypothetical protein
MPISVLIHLGIVGIGFIAFVVAGWQFIVRILAALLRA